MVEQTGSKFGEGVKWRETPEEMKDANTASIFLVSSHTLTYLER